MSNYNSLQELSKEKVLAIDFWKFNKNFYPNIFKTVNEVNDINQDSSINTDDEIEM